MLMGLEFRLTLWARCGSQEPHGDRPPSVCSRPEGLALKAIISDIHGNIDALEVALEEIAERGIEKQDTYCLGDVIGYGAAPNECVQHARGLAWCLQGNHEAALLHGAARFHPRARSAIEWTMNQLSFEDKLWITDWETIVAKEEHTGFTFVHASPRNHTEEYILPQRAAHEEWIRPLYDMFEKVCFVGHTHIPGVFRENFTYQHPDQFGGILDLSQEEGKTIINVGSIGQPRDQIPDGCYLLLDGEQLTWRRFKYDIEKAAQRVYDSEELDDQLGDRLKLGL